MATALIYFVRIWHANNELDLHAGQEVVWSTPFGDLVRPFHANDVLDLFRMLRLSSIGRRRHIVDGNRSVTLSDTDSDTVVQLTGIPRMQPVSTKPLLSDSRAVRPLGVRLFEEIISHLL